MPEPTGTFLVDGQPHRWRGRDAGRTLFARLIEEGNIPYVENAKGESRDIAEFDPDQDIKFASVRACVLPDAKEKKPAAKAA